MKKVLSIVLALALVFGFAGMTFAMGPSGADAATVGLVLTSFTVSDAMLSPLQMPNWSGTLAPTKTYSEGQPIWFVASYVQNKWVNDDDRNFSTVVPAGKTGGGITAKTTVFTSKDNCVNYSYSNAYMNFALVNGIQVIGASVDSAPTGGSVSTSSKELKVEMAAGAFYAPDSKTKVGTLYSYTNAANLFVGNADVDIAQTYYLQIMGFTNACSEAQGTAIAKCPIDINEFATVAAPNLANTSQNISSIAVATSGGLRFSWLNVYNANNAIKYKVAKYIINDPAPAAGTLVNELVNIGVKNGDNLYMIYDDNGDQIIGFVSSGSVYKGMVKCSMPGGAFNAIEAVQYNSDAGGKYVFTTNAGGAAGVRGTEAVTKADLQAVMDLFGFNFGNDYPILDKHIEALAGLWQVLEAKYNVAAAVITNPDPGVDIVPKTGDASTAFGMIMVAIAGLAAVGFVMMKRVRG